MRQNKASDGQQQVEIKKNDEAVTKKSFKDQDKSQVVTDKIVEIKKKKKDEPLIEKQTLTIDNVQPSISVENEESQWVCIYKNGVVLCINFLFLI